MCFNSFGRVEKFASNHVSTYFARSRDLSSSFFMMLHANSDTEGIFEPGGEVALLNAWLGRRNRELYA
jgi:hypothetical protein